MKSQEMMIGGSQWEGETSPLVRGIGTEKYGTTLVDHVGSNHRRRNILLIGFGVVALLLAAGTTAVRGVSSEDHHETASSTDETLIQPAKIQVPRNRPGFPSFQNYNGGGPMNVTYDGRSFMINGDRVLFLGGSTHPTRATKETWDAALDEAVHFGLNLITIYVMWADHQSSPDSFLDWSFQQACDEGSYESQNDDPEKKYQGTCEVWNLAQAIRSAASRGLFVHIRLGPYVCAEYSYGGIPEWLPLVVPNISMRRANEEWMEVMELFLTNAVTYLTMHKLFAYQGGPIVMAQIENELGGSAEPGSATLQQYADWCGEVAQKLAPNVVWTMCNGLSANSTIVTYNGNFEEPTWLENHGDSGRIQVDQPAMWTEDEGGFQVWGEEPSHPTDYFWGRTARSMAYDCLRWFARGGTHHNYYMWWGGYNRKRTAAAGIMNMYASDAPLCPSGQRHQPKFGHLQALSILLADVAPVLLDSPSALTKGELVEILNDDGIWEIGHSQQMFEYQSTQEGSPRLVSFVENAANVSHQVKIPLKLLPDGRYKIFSLEAHSAVLIVDGNAKFDSSSVQQQSKAFERKFSNPIPMFDWKHWKEAVGASASDPRTQNSTMPIEQTLLNFNGKISSDYAWYETDFYMNISLPSASLHIESQQANSFLVYVDNVYVGTADTHNHRENEAELIVQLRAISRGKHKLALLSESLGYGNLIGRWGATTKAKSKGITGDVVIKTMDNRTVQSFTDGRLWRSCAGLHGETFLRDERLRRPQLKGLGDKVTASSFPLWSSVRFDTPDYDPKIEALFVDITMGRGHLYLNGNDLGRYWNTTRGNTRESSQRFYFLPNDFLCRNGTSNELVLFDAYGGRHQGMRLVLSWVEASNSNEFEDKVGYLQSCV